MILLQKRTKIVDLFDSNRRWSGAT